MQRIKLCDRILPKYSPGEERLNAISHGIGIFMGLLVLILCTSKSGTTSTRIGSILYGVCMIAVYTISTIYHALPPRTAKKVFQILDHCTIYLLIAGTYTPILLGAFVAQAPAVGWTLLVLQWAVAVFAIVLNAIDLKKFRPFSYTAYIVMGWAIIFVAPTAMELISRPGLLYLLLGGISYTVGAILFGIGSKLPWFHGVFHIFVLLGSFLQFLSIYLYIL